MTTAALQRPWLVLAGLALGVTVTNGFARFAYGLLLPAMKSEMGWTYAQAGWLNTANALGYIGGALLTMLLIRRVPPTRLFAFGVVTTTLALLATGLNPALGWQTGWRIAAGVMGAMSFSTAGTLAAILAGLRRCAEVYFAAWARYVVSSVAGAGVMRDMAQVNAQLHEDVSFSRITAISSHPMGTCRIRRRPSRSAGWRPRCRRRSRAPRGRRRRWRRRCPPRAPASPRRSRCFRRCTGPGWR